MAYSRPQSARQKRLREEFMRIAPECALVTACDSRHAPYLFNAIASIHARFPDHPVLHVFDLGMNNIQRKELLGVSWVQLREVEPFATHWKQNWSWKPYILTKIPQRYIFYFDASNIVLYRPLLLWFLAIARNGYFLLENGQKLRQTTPSNYWALFGCEPSVVSEAPTFGAGLMGFDLHSPARALVDEVLKRTIEGWNLGRSANEVRLAYDRSVIRDCEYFRADQTLFNLAFRRYYSNDLVLRDELKYCGYGGSHDSPTQYLWYSRRNIRSLTYILKPIGSASLAFLLNRITSLSRIIARDIAIVIFRLWSQRKSEART
jgi:hypothetical protein